MSERDGASPQFGIPGGSWRDSVGEFGKCRIRDALRLSGDVIYDVVFLTPLTLERGLEGLTMVHISKDRLQMKLRYLWGEETLGNAFYSM
jgi:hypothetical protein